MCCCIRMNGNKKEKNLLKAIFGRFYSFSIVQIVIDFIELLPLIFNWFRRCFFSSFRWRFVNCSCLKKRICIYKHLSSNNRITPFCFSRTSNTNNCGLPPLISFLLSFSSFFFSFFFLSYQVYELLDCRSDRWLPYEKSYFFFILFFLSFFILSLSRTFFFSLSRTDDRCNI